MIKINDVYGMPFIVSRGVGREGTMLRVGIREGDTPARRHFNKEQAKQIGRILSHFAETGDVLDSLSRNGVPIELEEENV